MRAVHIYYEHKRNNPRQHNQTRSANMCKHVKQRANRKQTLTSPPPKGSTQSLALQVLLNKFRTVQIGHRFPGRLKNVVAFPFQQVLSNTTLVPMIQYVFYFKLPGRQLLA